MIFVCKRREILIKCGKDIIIVEVSSLDTLFDDIETAKTKTIIKQNNKQVFFIYLKPREFDDVKSHTVKKDDDTIIFHGEGDEIDDTNFKDVSSTNTLTSARVSGMLNSLKMKGYDIGELDYDYVRKDQAYVFIARILQEESDTNVCWLRLLDRETIYGDKRMDIPELNKIFETAMSDANKDDSDLCDEEPNSEEKCVRYLIMFIRRNYAYNELSNKFTLNIDDDVIRYMIKRFPDWFSRIVKRALESYKLKCSLSFSAESTIKMADLKPELGDNIICFDCDVIAVEDRMTVTTQADFKCMNCMAVRSATLNAKRVFDDIMCYQCDRIMKQHRIISTQYVQILWLSEFMTEATHGKPDTIKGKIYGDFVGESFVGQKKRIVGQFKSEKKDRSKYNEIFIDVVTVIDLDDDDILLPTDEELDEWKNLISKLGDDFLTRLTELSYTIIGHIGVKKSSLLAVASAPKTTKKVNNLSELLLGDPGVAKSKIIQETLNLSQKSIFTTGKGNSAAGLTGGMDRISSNSPLVFLPGALTIANEGLAGVDEIDKMNEHDRESMLTAMSEGFVPINKVGVHGTLPTDTTIIAAANPKTGRYRDKPILDQINISEPLLSRFTMIWLMRDVVDEYNDACIAQHILNDMSMGTEITVDSEKIKRFLNYVKLNYYPTLSKEAKKHLQQYYIKVRKLSSRQDRIPVDARKVEDLSKLSIAYARINMRDLVTESDAKKMCELFDESLESFGIDPKNGNIMETFKSKRENNKQEFQDDALKRLRLDGGTFTEDDFIVELARDGAFYTQESAKILFRRLQAKGDIFKNTDDTYR